MHRRSDGSRSRFFRLRQRRLDRYSSCSPGPAYGRSAGGAANRLYKNNRDGTFTDVTEKAGLARTGWAYGVTVGDYDNDGFDDLFITYWGQNVLYRNNGDGTFTDVTKEAGLLTSRRAGAPAAPCSITTGTASWICSSPTTWISTSRSCHSRARTGACNWKGVPVNCGPRGLPYGHHLLYHNNGDGTFTDVTKAAGIGKSKGSYGLTAVAADFDNDGWPDIYVACDSTPSLLFRNNHDGTFTEEGLERGVALNEDGQEQAGMGLGIGDYNLDGQLDIFKTHFAEDTPILYKNDGQGELRGHDHPLRAGGRDPFRLLGRRHGGFRQRRLAGSVRGHRQCVSGSGEEAARLSAQDAAVHLPQSAERRHSSS